MRSQLTTAILLLVTICVVAGCDDRQPANSSPGSGSQNSNQRDIPPPGEVLEGDAPPMPEPVNVTDPDGVRVESIATGLEVPWDMAFPSQNRIYVTERPGRVRLIEAGRLREAPYARIQGVTATGESGLMGIALHPDYPNPRQVFLMYTYTSGGARYNRVSRFDDTGSTLANETVLIEGIKGATYHDGGALRFGPDGMLYVGTGDAGEPESAQDRNALTGKILRMTPNGERPPDNPFDESFVYAYGFRNVQGLTWNPSNGDLWATDHGPSGEFGLRAKDAVYIVERGANHGWPRVLGVSDVRGVVDPVLYFPETAVPPALAVFYTGNELPRLQGDFFMASLRGEHLMRVVLSGAREISRIERWFATGTHQGRYGRLRAVVQGPDGALYVSTSNRDRRGQLRSGDDRILRISAR